MKNSIMAQALLDAINSSESSNAIAITEMLVKSNEPKNRELERKQKLVLEEQSKRFPEIRKKIESKKAVDKNKNIQRSTSLEDKVVYSLYNLSSQQVVSKKKDILNSLKNNIHTKNKIESMRATLVVLDKILMQRNHIDRQPISSLRKIKKSTSYIHQGSYEYVSSMTEEQLEARLLREKRRKELIEEEARIELYRMSQINKYSSSSTNLNESPVKVEIVNNFVSANANIKNEELKTQNPSLLKVVKNQEPRYFNKDLYQELIKRMPVGDAARICLNKELTSKYYNEQVIEGAFSYFNTLMYFIECKDVESKIHAIERARNKEYSESRLSTFISMYTYNKFYSDKLNAKVKKSQDKINVLSVRGKIEQSNSRGIVKKRKYSEIAYVETVDVKLNAESVITTISQREQSAQIDFKRRIANNFFYRCAVTGQVLVSILQACHIEEYAVNHNMDTSNGILLSADCHYMFDNDELGIEPESLTVHFNVECIYSKLFEGKRIGKHSIDLDFKKLNKKWERFLHKKHKEEY
ncbi:HNH endonuclease signature motif containing protein [Serratia fonticola]|uniref:HNH endonuclease signature motif containing protein n=1 Tax=Serratia fonticola TaxID=47917 RepID=UPI0021BACEB0|nr:HNH endonuclease signature motif containing protein [Serratia fonticola]